MCDDRIRYEPSSRNNGRPRQEQGCNFRTSEDGSVVYNASGKSPSIGRVDAGCCWRRKERDGEVCVGGRTSVLGPTPATNNNFVLPRAKNLALLAMQFLQCDCFLVPCSVYTCVSVRLDCHALMPRADERPTHCKESRLSGSSSLPLRPVLLYKARVVGCLNLTPRHDAENA
jgi:hypothetical protein